MNDYERPILPIDNRNCYATGASTEKCAFILRPLSHIFLSLCIVFLTQPNKRGIVCFEV